MRSIRIRMYTIRGIAVLRSSGRDPEAIMKGLHVVILVTRMHGDHSRIVDLLRNQKETEVRIRRMQ